jgi:hypothetical protein
MLQSSLLPQITLAATAAQVWCAVETAGDLSSRLSLVEGYAMKAHAGSFARINQPKDPATGS